MKPSMSQVRQNLRFVNFRQLLDSLHFDQHSLFDNDVDAISGSERISLVHNWNHRLSNDGKPTLAELPAEAFLVSGLEKTRPKLSVNLDRESNDRFT